MRKILIVDDEPGILDVLCCWLEDQDYQITTTTQAAEAIGMIPQLHPDLVITDIRMSPVDGWQVLEAVRKHNPLTPVLMMTGHLTTSQDADHAKRLGATDYITKPFHLDDFARRIDAALNAQPQPSSRGMSEWAGAATRMS